MQVNSAEVSGQRPGQMISDTDAEVIERGREGREGATRMSRRELACESTFAVAFVAAAVALQLEAPASHAFSIPAAGLMVAVFVALLAVEFEVGEGRTHPVQLVFVPMLFVLPARSVPLLVALAYLLSFGLRAVRQPRVAVRGLLAVSDSWFSLAPSLIFALSGAVVPSLVAGPVLVLAVAAQLASDCLVSSLRLWLGLGVDPRPQAAMFTWAYLVDALLSPIGVLAAYAAMRSTPAVLLVIPPAILLAVFATERRGRITTALELHRIVREREQRLRSIVQNSSDLIAIVDTDGTVRSVTGASSAVYGDPDAALATNLLDVIHPADVSLVSVFLHRAGQREPGSPAEAGWRMRFADGSWRHVEAIASNLLDDGRIEGLVLTIRDVNERTLFEEQLRHRAFHDPLTGLPNRALFYDRVEQALHREERGEHCAVLFIDMDDFKLVNDRYGHAAGDTLLVESAQRLRTCVSSADTAARLGGDEFGILLSSAGGMAACAIIAERVLAAFRTPLRLGGKPVSLMPSIGIALPPPGSTDADELLRQADLAMYAAKQDGKGSYQLYDPAFADAADPEPASSSERGAWFRSSREQREEVLELLDRPDAIESLFQPIVDLRTGRIAGYEALTRFHASAKRAPNVWFSQAHRCGLGYQLEALAIESALRAPGRPAGTHLSINLSPSALTADEVRGALPADLVGITVEITENELVSRTAAVSAAIADLRLRGAQLAVDDAGSGYAGLTHLMALAPDVIKLDRALIDGIAEDPAKVALVESFVGYAAKIGASVCAEGIETLDDLAVLADLDVTYGQGYVLARPGPPWSSVDDTATRHCMFALDRVLSKPLDGALGRHIDGSGLEHVSARLSEARSLAGLASLAGELAALLGADDLVISRLAPGGERLESLGVGPGRHAIAVRSLSASPLVRDVIERSRLAQVLEADSVDREALALMRRHADRALLMVPVRCADRPLGLLEAFRRDGHPWSRGEITRARIIANQVGAVLDRLPEPGKAEGAVRETAQTA